MNYLFKPSEILPLTAADRQSEDFLHVIHKQLFSVTRAIEQAPPLKSILITKSYSRTLKIISLNFCPELRFSLRAYVVDPSKCVGNRYKLVYQPQNRLRNFFFGKLQGKAPAVDKESISGYGCAHLGVN